MTKRSLTAQAVHLASVTGVGLAAVAYVSAASAASTASPAKLGKVTVTGTRIKRTSIETAQPITRISREQIQKTGYTNIGQLLGRLSFSGAFANDSGRFSNGAHNVDLRNLGANRNLVLVNGKRWMQGLGGATNLNTIPTSIIDHIEILQDGASAVYGSDAIAGVVNIITVKNFNGAEAHAYYGIRNANGHWDGQTKQYDFTIGGGNDRGNVVFNTTYRKKIRSIAARASLLEPRLQANLAMSGATLDPSLGDFGSSVRLLVAGPSAKRPVVHTTLLTQRRSYAISRCKMPPHSPRCRSSGTGNRPMHITRHGRYI